MSCSSIIFHRSKEDLVISYKDIVSVLVIDRQDNYALICISDIVNLNMPNFVKIIMYLPSRFRRRFLISG